MSIFNFTFSALARVLSSFGSYLPFLFAFGIFFGIFDLIKGLVRNV